MGFCFLVLFMAVVSIQFVQSAPGDKLGTNDAAALVAVISCVAATLSSMLLLSRRRGPVVNRPSSRTTQYFEKLARRERRWFKKHIRINPDMLDVLTDHIRPVFVQLFGHPHHNTVFDLKVGFHFSLMRNISINLRSNSTGLL